MEHTAEPWRIGTPPPNGEQTIGDMRGMMVAVATTGHGVSSVKNAKRICACVNACAGIADPEQFISDARSYSHETVSAIVRQRDELLADLTSARAALLREGMQRDALLETLKHIECEPINAEYMAREAIDKAQA